MAQEWEGGFSCHASAEVLLGRAAQSGDLEAFNALVLRHQDALFNLARYILRDDSLAADAVQEAFLSAFQKIASFRGGSLRAWLMRILVNKCRDDLRRWRRYAEISLESHPPDQDAGGYDTWLCGGEPSPSEQMESRELQHALEYCFHGLPPAFREGACLVDVE